MFQQFTQWINNFEVGKKDKEDDPSGMMAALKSLDADTKKRQRKSSVKEPRSLSTTFEIPKSESSKSLTPFGVTTSRSGRQESGGMMDRRRRKSSSLSRHELPKEEYIFKDVDHTNDVFLHCYAAPPRVGDQVQGATENYVRFYYRSNETFNEALELNNRIGCSFVAIPGDNRRWVSNKPFYECKGKVKVTQRLCCRCRDSGKSKQSTDTYYIDIAEVCQDRTVYCRGCMGRILYTNVGTVKEEISRKLMRLRRMQQDGIFIQQRVLLED